MGLTDQRESTVGERVNTVREEVRQTSFNLAASCSPRHGSATSPLDTLCQSYIFHTTNQLLLVKLQAELYQAADRHAPSNEFQDAVDEFRNEFKASDSNLAEQVIESADQAFNGKFVSSAIGFAKGTIMSILDGKKAKQNLIAALENREKVALAAKAMQISSRLALLQQLRETSQAEYERFIKDYAKLAHMAAEALRPTVEEVILRHGSRLLATTHAVVASHRMILTANEPVDSQPAESTEPAESADNILAQDQPLAKAHEAQHLLVAELNRLQTIIERQKDSLKQQEEKTRHDQTYPLVRDLFALFLIRQPGTASTGAFSRWWGKKDHAERANDIAIELNNSQSIPRNNFSGNDLEIKAITAKLKRVSACDMDSQSEAYVESQYRLVKAMHLLQQARTVAPAQAKHLSLKERLSFYADLIFNEVDQMAGNSVSAQLLDERTSCVTQCFVNHGMTVKRYGDDLEKDMRDRLQRVLSEINHHQMLEMPALPEPEVSAADLVELINNVLRFYYHTYVSMLEAFTRDVLQVDPNVAEHHQLIHERAQKMLNRELADDTPSNYYHGPLAGITLFLANSKGRPRIAVKYNKENDELAIDYHGEELQNLQHANTMKSTNHSTARWLTVSPATHAPSTRSSPIATPCVNR